MAPLGCPETSVPNYLSCETSQKNEDVNILSCLFRRKLYKLSGLLKGMQKFCVGLLQCALQLPSPVLFIVLLLHSVVSGTHSNCFRNSTRQNNETIVDIGLLFTIQSVKNELPVGQVETEVESAKFVEKEIVYKLLYLHGIELV